MVVVQGHQGWFIPEPGLGLPGSSTPSLLLRAWILQVFEVESLLKMEK